MSKNVKLEFNFLLDFSGLFQLAKRVTPCNALTFQLPSEDQTWEGNILWLSSLNLTDISYNNWSMSNTFLKTVATFVEKAGFIGLQGGFLLRLFTTQM